MHMQRHTSVGLDVSCRCDVWSLQISLHHPGIHTALQSCFSLNEPDLSIKPGMRQSVSISTTAASLPFSFRGSHLLQHEQAQHPPSPLPPPCTSPSCHAAQKPLSNSYMSECSCRPALQLLFEKRKKNRHSTERCFRSGKIQGTCSNSPKCHLTPLPLLERSLTLIS